MTRKQAFLAVIDRFLAKNDFTTANKLQEILNEMPYVKWTESSIKDLVEQFMADHGRLPTSTDFGKSGLPAHPVVRHTCGLTAHNFMATFFPVFYEPELTKRQAMERAIEEAGVLTETAKKIKEVLDDYPLTKWNTELINDGIRQFYIENNRLPIKEDFKSTKTLPYMEIFCTYLSSTRIDWFKKHFPDEYKTYEKARNAKKKIISLQVFIDEYNRIKPITEKEFDEKRDATKIPRAAVVRRNNNCTCWADLISRCGLKVYEKQPYIPLIKKIKVVVI